MESTVLVKAMGHPVGVKAILNRTRLLKRHGKSTLTAKRPRGSHRRKLVVRRGQRARSPGRKESEALSIQIDDAVS
jgi:hypothetical protein